MTKLVMVSVQSDAPWPSVETIVAFAGTKIRLLPPVKKPNPLVELTHPLAVVDSAEGSEQHTVAVIRRFLNALAWREQAFIREVDVSFGGCLIRTVASVPHSTTSQWFSDDELPDPADPKARIALAFYREGLSLDHIAYRFLSFFKVLNVRFSQRREQIAWINGQLTAVKAADAVNRLNVLRPHTADVGEYLYASGRCAVAHAFATPLVDPDNIRDQQRLSADMPLMQSLAALLIEQEYGVSAPRWKSPF